MSTKQTIVLRRIAACLFALLATGNAAADTTVCTKIAAVPHVITQQGVYCLAQDLASEAASGAAITIGTNNVTLDCNDRLLDGSAAGAASQAKGVYALNRLNVTVRNCAVRGFHMGIHLSGAAGGGHKVLDNRVHDSLHTGIAVNGGGNLVRGNLVNNTGGASGSNTARGIEAAADVIDNAVNRVFAAATDSYPIGIRLVGSGGMVRGNRVRALVESGAGHVRGIEVDAVAASVVDNLISEDYWTGPVAAGWGVVGSVDESTLCQHNRVVRIASPFTRCHNNLGSTP